VIDAVGLEDCGELVAQATPEQLSQIFDVDLWKPARPGLDDEFDADRFGVWLEVLVDAGPEIAAEKLAGMSLEPLVAGFTRYLRVFDIGSVLEFETTSGERWDYSAPVRDVVSFEIGGYHVAAKRDEQCWDAIADVLVALETRHPSRFHELMRAVRSCSNSAKERDGFHSLLDDDAQMMADVMADRERRRQQRGFASPADARAFLQMARSVTPESIAPNPIAHAYARSIEVNRADEGTAATSDEEAGVVQLLEDAGVAALGMPRGLIGSGETTVESTIQRLMRLAFDRDPVAYGERNFELAYLANVLLSGCSIMGRPFTPKEAADGAVAVCNLGLERLGSDADYLIAHDLIGAFQVGWSVLHREVCLSSARTLADVLSTIRVRDDEQQVALNMLGIRVRRETDHGQPWKAAAALDVLGTIDMPAWAAMTGLIAECPVIHAGLKASLDSRVRSVDPKAFEFIATLDQLALVRAFMSALPDIIRA
jgi:hypothetical protein